MSKFGKFQDLMTLNYYEGWFSGAIQDESYVPYAIEWYFGWLTGLANEYDIPADYDETPDGCDALREDIEEYLTEHIVHCDLEDIKDYVLATIQDRYNNKKPDYIYEDDILEMIDNERMVTELMDMIYIYCIEEIKKEYKVF